MACFIFAAFVILLDQMSKIWVTRGIEIGAQIELIPGVIGLTHAQNTGASFGIFSGVLWLLIAIPSICVVLLIVLITKLKGVWSRIGLAAVLGGAVGNLIDRVLHGFVIDMFEFKFIDFAIFNVADCFITIGGVLFVLSMFIRPREPLSPRSEAPVSPGGGKAGGESSTIFGGTAKDLSETKILEEYDIERLLREYNSDEKDD